MKIRLHLVSLLLCFCFSSCAQPEIELEASSDSSNTVAIIQPFGQQLSEAALALTEVKVTYDPSYFSIAYPGGDVPSHLGVCTDVVIRAYRLLDIDLQELVHQDMKNHFGLYPTIWGLTKTDSNIDHRRVPNLMVFFNRNGQSLALSQESEDYVAGDIVCWRLSGGMTHIGVVVEQMNGGETRPLIVHNIGAGQVLQDCLFDYEIIGHYRYN